MAEATSPKQEDEPSRDNSCCDCTKKLTQQFLRTIFCEGLQGRSRGDESWKTQLDVSTVQLA